MKAELVPDPPRSQAVAYPTARICAEVVQWAETSEDVEAILDAKARLEAIDTYLERTSMNGRREVAAAMRRLETRIGQILGAAAAGRPRGTSVATEVSLSKDERHEFRQMAARPDAVEDVIAESTDEQPASRRAVLRRISEEASTSGLAADAGSDRASVAAQAALVGLSKWNVAARRAIETWDDLVAVDHYRQTSTWAAGIQAARQALDEIEQLTERTLRMVR